MIQQNTLEIIHSRIWALPMNLDSLSEFKNKITEPIIDGYCGLYKHIMEYNA